LLQFTKLRRRQISGATMSELLKAVEEAARKLASTIAARDVVQQSLDGIIAEQERRAVAKAAAQKPKDLEPPTKGN
jgi:cell division FtsZ-interacting protein ZapD